MGGEAGQRGQNAAGAALPPAPVAWLTEAAAAESGEEASRAAVGEPRRSAPGKVRGSLDTARGEQRSRARSWSHRAFVALS